MERTLPQPDRDHLDLVTVLHALADPVRLRLITNLAGQVDPQACGPEANEVGVAASTLSHHWRVLREAGLTSTVADGRRRWVLLRIDDLDHRFPGLLAAVLAGAVPPVKI